MTEKNLTEQESLRLITEMISRTKERYIGEGNIMLMWGWLTVGVTGLVWLLMMLTHNPASNWVWFLIPAVGGIATPIMSKKTEKERGVVTYTDRMTSQIWTAVGLLAFLAMGICFGYALAGINTWSVMFIYALVIVPFGEIAQGIIVKERSLIAGGAIGMTIGIVTTSCIVAGMTLSACWFLPLFMLAFLCMMLVPGYIINHKSRKA